jgi:hypothetical protein
MISPLYVVISILLIAVLGVQVYQDPGFRTSSSKLERVHYWLCISLIIVIAVRLILFFFS